VRSIASIPRPGDVINGQFLLGRELGRGSFGVVYEAKQLDLQRTVALKVLQPRALARDDVAERFKREALLASSLSSRHAVTVYAFGVSGESAEVQGLPFIAMEYLEGEDLYYLLARTQHLSIEDTVPILHQGLLSLAEAHDKGIIHRDLKPENLFVCRMANETIVKVLDFGIAKAIGGDWDASARQRLTEVGTVCGTPEFMAPEQASGEPNLTAAVDVYAMGCIGYQLLTGRQPYEGNSPMDIALKHMTHPIPPLPPAYEASPLGAMVKKAMAKAPADRFQDAAEFARAIEGFARQRGISLQLEPPPAYAVSGEFLPYEDELATWISRRGTDEQLARQSTAVTQVRGRANLETRTTDSIAAVSGDRAVLTHASPMGDAAMGFRDTAVSSPPLDRHPTSLVSRVAEPPPPATQIVPLGHATMAADQLATAVVRADRPRRLGDDAPTTVGPAPGPPERPSSPVALYAGGIAVILFLCVAVAVTVIVLLPHESSPDVAASPGSTAPAPSHATPSALVVFTLDSIPAHAEVYEGAVHLGQTPLVVERPTAPEPLKVTLRKAGFRDTPATMPLQPSAAGARTITLEPDNTGVVAPRHGEDGESAPGVDAGAPESQPGEDELDEDPPVNPEVQTPTPRQPPGRRSVPIRRRTPPPRETPVTPGPTPLSRPPADENVELW